MATIIQKVNMSIEIRYIDADGIRRSLYPGKIAKRTAETIGSRIDHIVSRQITCSDPDRDVSHWVSKLPDKLHKKLVKAGLAAARMVVVTEPQPEPDLVPTLKEWTESYIATHPGKGGTIEQLEITARSLRKKFGDDRRIDAINAGDAEVYRKWLQTDGNERKNFKTGLAEGTVRRRIGRSKQFFNAAIKHEIITRNPFAGEASAVGGNDERLFMVPSEWVEKCIVEAPCEDWRVILALARYAGMRSHECRIQRWEDIDLANNRMIVRSNKTPPTRYCPIFPELRPHLLRAREMSPKNAEYLQTRYDHDVNILTALERIVKKAGLTPWPKLMQNLRATRETELLANYPAKDVTSWLGNSPSVANKHYAMTLRESFDRAVIQGAKIEGVTSTSSSTPKVNEQGEGEEVVDSKTPPKIPPTLQDNRPLNPDTKKADAENPVNNWICLASALSVLPLSCPTRT